MAKKQLGGQIEEAAGGRKALPKLPVDDVSDLASVRKLPKGKLSGVSGLQSTGSMPSSLGERHLSLEQESEALEAARNFAEETGLDIADSRPCIASLFYSGVGGGGIGRKPSAFILALEFAICGLVSPDVAKHLQTFGSRCSPPLTQNVLAQVLRSVSKDNNCHRYGCAKLQAWCVGEGICPWKKGTAAGLSLCRQSGPYAFVMFGWPGYLKGSSTNVYLALLGMRIQRGFAPNKAFTFFFAQLELRSGVSRSELRKHLEALEKVGLISELKIGPSWNSGKRERSKVKLTAPIPDPKLLRLSFLRSKSEFF